MLRRDIDSVFELPVDAVKRLVAAPKSRAITYISASWKERLRSFAGRVISASQRSKFCGMTVLVSVAAETEAASPHSFSNYLSFVLIGFAAEYVLFTAAKESDA